MKKRIIRILCLLLLCVLCSGFFSGCTGSPENMLYASSGLGSAISPLSPEYKAAEHNMAALDALNAGAVIEAYDVQAQNNAAYFYPLTLETVVIAIDRSRTDIVITSWSDLSVSDVCVNIRGSSSDLVVEGYLALAAVCYGLDGDSFHLDSIVELLEPLHEKQLLVFDETKTPIHICFDSEAAARIKNGENLEIVIPAEGTLTYTRGLLSKTPLTLPDNTEQALLDAGLRLTDGRCDADSYPPAEAYAPAASLTDYSQLMHAMQKWDSVLRRDIRHTHLFRSADGWEHILFPAIFLVAVVLWVASMIRRSQQKEIVRILTATGILITCWIVCRVIKYQIYGETVFGQYLWYIFYLFQGLLPLLLLRIASLIGVGEGEKQMPKWLRGIGALNAALIALVLTNNLHGLVFRLPVSGWSGDYSYGIVYFVFTVITVLEVIGSIILLFARLKHSPRRYGFVFPLIVVGALIAFIAGYSARIPFFFDSDLTLMMCAFALLFIELCIRTGQIPVNSRYRGLFQSAELNLQITGAGGESILRSKDAEPIDAMTWRRLKESDAPIHADDNTLLLQNRISGGYAVWLEDITSINALKAELEAANKNLMSANDTLAGIAQAKEQAARLKTRTELYEYLERDIAVHEQRLAEMLHDGRDVGTVAVLVCYIKRRCQLLLLEMGGHKAVAYADTAMYLEELADIARQTGIECLVFCGLGGDLDIQRATVFYDFFNALLEWSARHTQEKLVVQLVPEKGDVVMKILADTGTLAFEPSDRVKREIAGAGGFLEKRDLEDMVCIVLSFPQGGERDA